MLALALAFVLALAAAAGHAQPLPGPGSAQGRAEGRAADGWPPDAASGQALEPRHLRGGEPEFVLPVPERLALPEVQASLESLRRSQREALEAALSRALLYRGFIAQRLAERGLPPELLYLPLLESAFRVGAVSRSGAVGLWQLMANTAGPLGLRQDRWVEERRDFWRSTEAALTKIADNHRRLGDWDLALAAYNCGLGALQRIMARADSRDYWTLRRRGLLPAETAAFVPRFYALVALCSRPARYGLTVSWQAAQRWERLPLERSVELDLLAKAAGIPESLLRSGNAELRTPITPPGAHLLKVPAEAAARVAELLADPEAPLLLYGYHTIRSGDTLYGLARQHGLAVELLSEANPGVDPRRLRIGSLLRIPLLGDARRTGLPEPQPHAAASQAAAGAATATLAASFAGQYTVRSGDTLWAIARVFGTTVEQLSQANGRSLDDILKPGETLKVPAQIPGGVQP